MIGNIVIFKHSNFCILRVESLHVELDLYNLQSIIRDSVEARNTENNKVTQRASGPQEMSSIANLIYV